jgi:hypothetical protein
MKVLKEFAKKLDKTQYPFTLSLEEVKYCKDNGIVVVFGCSDDLMEFRGAIYDEFDCYGGGTCYLTKDGLFEDDCDCKYARQSKEKCKSIKGLWCKGKYSWQYETDIPHETFDIMEDDDFYCKGIIFYKKDLGE